MNIFIFANENEIISHPYLAKDKAEAQEKFTVNIDSKIKRVNDNLKNIKDNIKSCEDAIKEFTAAKESGEVTEDDIDGINFIEFQEEQIKDHIKLRKEQNKALKALSFNVDELNCFKISEKV